MSNAFTYRFEYDPYLDCIESITRKIAADGEDALVLALKEKGFEKVVRCRDCKHCVTTIWRECGSEWTEYECNLLRDFGGTPLTIALNDFCSWGERRDG